VGDCTIQFLVLFFYRKFIQPPTRNFRRKAKVTRNALNAMEEKIVYELINEIFARFFQRKTMRTWLWLFTVTQGAFTPSRLNTVRRLPERVAAIFIPTRASDYTLET
jgi:hypothetical protein